MMVYLFSRTSHWYWDLLRSSNPCLMFKVDDAKGYLTQLTFPQGKTYSCRTFSTLTKCYLFTLLFTVFSLILKTGCHLVRWYDSIFSLKLLQQNQEHSIKENQSSLHQLEQKTDKKEIKNIKCQERRNVVFVVGLKLISC